MEYWSGKGGARQVGGWLGGGWRAAHLRPAPVCRDPCDHIPDRSYALYQARAVIVALINSFEDHHEVML